MAKKAITIKDIQVRLRQETQGDYFCLTDLARPVSDDTNTLIRNWLRNANTLEFLGVWESKRNDRFNVAEYEQLLGQSGLNRFAISVSDWVDRTGAVGIFSESGRYGGTYAHSHITIHFANWLSPEFYVHIIEEFERLKVAEARRLGSGWDVRREIARANFHIHTEAVRQYLVPVLDWNTQREAIYQASEADLINLAVFGFTARQWKEANPGTKGNLRDQASAEQLLVLANIESLNAKLIQWDTDREERLRMLHETAREQMSIISNKRSMKALQKHTAEMIRRLEEKKKR